VNGSDEAGGPGRADRGAPPGGGPADRDTLSSQPPGTGLPGADAPGGGAVHSRGGPLAPHADLFARTALAGVTREYPNAPAHPFLGPEELLPPRTYHPSFYGAYDWHSSVHSHWLLVRLLRRYAGHIDADAVTRVLDEHLAPAALGAEAGYLRAHPSFERPYGWAWLLALTAETGALGVQRWNDALTPLAYTVAELMLRWLPKAGYPVRHGTHGNSAFALGLVLDSAERAGVPELATPVRRKLREWFADDRDAHTRWEPSGTDFLSPALCEADAVRRVMPREEFTDWLTGFLPELSAVAGPFLTPPHVTDPADPQIGHLLGLCLSRAAALRRLASALPVGDPRAEILATCAGTHLAAGLPATASSDFTTSHWLTTFAALALEAADPSAFPAPLY
jgi:hypothetical protein